MCCDCCGAFGRTLLTGLALGCFIYQFSCLYYLFDLMALIHSFFYVFKAVYIVFFTFMIISFFQTYYTDPGFIVKENNLQFFLLYMILRKIARIRGDKYNKNNKLVINPPNTENDFEIESSCDEEEQVFKKEPFHEELYTKCKEQCEQVSKCKKCHITRVPIVHHCPECHKCVYNRDHHCIWFNTCIGQFNQKYFIQFLFYQVISSLLSIFISITYKIIPEGLMLFEKGVGQCLMLIYLIIIDLIMIFLCGKLLYDQYLNLRDDSMIYDFKKNKMIELRTKKEVLYEIMGGPLSIYWFLPLTRGGFYDFYSMEVSNIDKKK